MGENKLPDYVEDNIAEGVTNAILHTPSQEIRFPLSDEDKRDIRIVEAKFDAEENMAGLAAPQIGIAKKIIVFAAPENPDLKKFRKDFTQTMPKTIWINPSYEGIGDEKVEDYEACFSVKEMAGLVPRYTKVRYRAYNDEGHPIEGVAEGFLARIIQHEIDHVDGILWYERAVAGSVMTIEAYREMRKQAIESQSNSDS